MSPHHSLLLAVLALTAVTLTGCGEDEAGGNTDAGAGTTASDSGPCEYVAGGSSARDVDLPPSSPEPADALTLTTNRGDIGLTLRAEETPCTAGSFTSLAEQGYYDDTPCHRLTTEGIFVLQCGDPTGTGSGGPGYSFADELTGDETYPAGTLAMANAGADTNGSQFFIVYDETPLPARYTVFGEVDAEGLSLVEEVAQAGSDDSNAPGDGAPREEVVIESVG
ncbi:MAG: Peptidyl-prolyl cis-trans isomerase [uncultured Nocardioidaceae bacterium]|uniref:Peptidyl-prolyl cis-trans isomerase n=1 Tax=uncultured Nocardioidaceae bacterium TaxID=253824 RepID=A0A6J4LGP8_9ACTN|nr:MAG: Peptidyl-prolyl cis-trans isomerase [uncultured Nocardioidaceae bacterium]